MDIWHVLEERALKDDFGRSRLILRIAKFDKDHSSIAEIADEAKEANIGDAFLAKLDAGTLRYIIAKSIADDLLVSVYNVNGFEAVVERVSGADKFDFVKLMKLVSQMKRRNLEIRIFGLLNGSKLSIDFISKLKNAVGGALVEVDVFGDEYRHIALDLRTGQSYELLLENRIYRPGELKVKQQTGTEAQTAAAQH
ncbi:MAG: hypothetical protein QW346_01070 [Candidatus Micrarchaeaceae archaeon]